MPLGIHMLRDYEERTVTKIPKALGAKRTKRGQGLYSVMDNWIRPEPGFAFFAG